MNKEKERNKHFPAIVFISVAFVSFAGCLALGFFQNFFFCSGITRVRVTGMIDGISQVK